MSYVQDNLMPDEKIILTARIHPFIFLGPFIAAVLGIFLLIIDTLSTPSVGNSPQRTTAVINLHYLSLGGVIFILVSIMGSSKAIISILTTEFAVTNRRVIAKHGFIRRHTLELYLNKVESVGVHQTVFGRLMGYGTLVINGTGGTRESFMPILDPLAVKRKFNLMVERYSQNI